MKDKKIFSVIVAVVIITFGILVASKETSNSAGLKIGVILPLTGENAVIGEGIKKSLDLANKQNDNQFDLIYEDDHFDPKVGITAYHKLRDFDKVDAIINVTPTTADAIMPLIETAPIIVFQIAEPSHSREDTVFQIMPSGLSLYGELGRVVARRFSKVALVYQDTSATFQNAATEFETTFDHGAEKITSDIYPIKDQMDSVRIATIISNKKYDAVSVLATPSVGASFLKSWYSLKNDGEKIFCNPDMEVTISIYVDVLGLEALDGCVSVFFENQNTSVFSEMYEKEYGKDPSFAADYAFDLIGLIESTYVNDINKWKNNLSSIEYSGLSGLIRFNDDGTRISNYSKKVFVDGKFIETP